MQPFLQEGLIPDPPQEICRPRRIGLTEVFEVVEVQYDAPCTLSGREAQQVSQHPRTVQQQRPGGIDNALALSTSYPKTKGRKGETASTQEDAADLLLGGLQLRARNGLAVREHGVVDASEQLAQQVIAGPLSTDRDDVVGAPVARRLGIGLDGLHERGFADSRTSCHRLPGAGAAADCGEQLLPFPLPPDEEAHGCGM